MADLIESFASTRTHAKLWIGVDEIDPMVERYNAVLRNAPDWVKWTRLPTTGMVRGLNLLAQRAVNHNTPVDTYIGFMGDDHRPRTAGWDDIFTHALDEMGGGVAYGNDLIQGANLPTHVVMSSTIIAALRGMAPTTLTHLYVDNYWKALGEGIGRLSYLNDVIVEHMHPIAGKAEWDDGYRRVNDGALYQRDANAFTRYCEDEYMLRDIELAKGMF